MVEKDTFVNTLIGKDILDSYDDNDLYNNFQKLKKMNFPAFQRFFVTEGRTVRKTNFNERIFSFSLYLIVNNICNFFEIEALLAESFENEIPVEELIIRKKYLTPEMLGSISICYHEVFV
jgi:hypothetical protein